MLNFDELCVSRRIKERLERTARSGNALNSYVFEGADGIGKKTAAQVFAAALLCEGEGRIPCGRCGACAKTGSYNHPDIIFVRRKKDKASLGIDDVREQITETVYVKPLLAEKKIYIIEDGGLLTVGAQNGLLKILEEPPAYAVFVLLTPKTAMLLDTVLSRSAVLSFLPLSVEEVHCCLQKKHPNSPEERLQFAARFSQGIIGRGLRLLEDEEFSELYRLTLHHTAELLRTDAAVTDFERFLLDGRDRLEYIIDFMLIFLRDCLFEKLNLEKQILCHDRLYEIKESCRTLSKKALVGAMDAVLRYQKRIAGNASASASALELLMSVREGMHDQGNRS